MHHDPHACGNVDLHAAPGNYEVRQILPESVSHVRPLCPVGEAAVEIIARSARFIRDTRDDSTSCSIIPEQPNERRTWGFCSYVGVKLRGLAGNRDLSPWCGDLVPRVEIGSGSYLRKPLCHQWVIPNGEK